MNIRDLEYVLALADKRHFGLAAKACHVSQPALSAQIKKLEERLGIQLFERTSREAIPTADAGFVIDSARIILEKAAAIRTHADLLRKGQRQKIVALGIIPTIAPYYLPDFFKAMAATGIAANLRWQILEDKTQTLIERLDEGRLDAAIMVVPAAGISHSHKKLFEEPLWLAVAKGHRLARKKDVRLQDIGDEDWLLLDDGHCLNSPMLDICARTRNPVKQHSFRATSLETLRHMVAGGSGMTLMPDMARRKNDGIAYIRLGEPGRHKRAVSLVWRKDGPNAADLAAIADQLRGA